MTPQTITINKRGILEECAAGARTVAHLPFYYAVQLNLPCNQKCIMCAPDGNHRKDVMPFEDFVALFEQ
ncbi:MAG: hypothetical protein ACREQQ_17665, partial [Candidatus Binatia bacterium]